MSGPSYDKLGVQRLMLSDRVRNETYQEAITKTVKPGDVVLDVGAGTGILSLFAVRAGARKVYAVERTEMAEMARQVIKKNGVADRVEIIHAKMETAQISEEIDVIISEWMGGYGVDEYVHVPVFIARDRWLKPGGKILPERVTALIVPVCDCRLIETLSFWRDSPYNVDLNPIADSTVNEVFWVQHHITRDTLLAQPQAMWLTDAYECSLEQAQGPFRASLSFSATRKGQLSALAAWFRAEFGNDIVLTNAPGSPETHWGRWIFPLATAIEIEPGMNIAVEFTCEPAGSGYCHNSWSVQIADGQWEHHHTAGRE